VTALPRRAAGGCAEPRRPRPCWFFYYGHVTTHANRNATGNQRIGEGGQAGRSDVVDDRAVAEAELLLEVGVEAEYGQIRMSVTGGVFDAPDWGAGAHDAVSGAGVILVATWGDECDPVTVRVYGGRPDLDGWTLVHTARLLVGTDGIDVGMTVSAVEHWVPVAAGEVAVEVWVHDPDERGEVTFVLSR
jgi:hypothetical protein